MKTTAYILEAFRLEKITHVFLVPGGLIDPFLPALSATPGLSPIVAAHEGGAACMADGYARASGRFGACMAIGGPGITNMVTALAAARTDGSPVVVVSGQVPTDWEGRGGFQDSSPATWNDLEVLQPLMVSSLIVENIHLVNHHLRATLTQMLAGAQGPAHLSLPLDIQKGEVHAPWQPLYSPPHPPRYVDLEAVAQIFRILVPAAGKEAAGKILILAGAGVEKSGAGDLLRKFAEEFHIPVATTLRAKGVFPEDHPLSLGVFGYAGHRPAIEAILSGEAEVLLVLGSGLNQRDTLYWDRKMLPRRALIHVDIDPRVPGRTWETEVPVVGDCREVLACLMQASPEQLSFLKDSIPVRRTWLESLRALGPRLYDVDSPASEAIPLHPARVVAALRRVLPRETVLVVDSGAHRAFCGHYWEAYEPRTYISATNLGPMGWAIPAGIGAKLACPGRPLAVVTGDGCMLMHGLEIQTAARYHVPVIFVVINNGALGNVWLRASKEGPGPAALTALPVHDWAALARGLGLQAATVEKPEELEPALQKALEAQAPFLLDVRCQKEFSTPVSPYNRAKKEWIDDD
jgi:acetolactate synthase-1/2/3 large subunit